ncbi:MAG: methylated-DNA--[protein]-cysteine S-methyltransferase [Deltaproteobacteria bacterium]|uniref:Methylated-DNA--[protein]-cysteine S-methyltransferase n=1 Tax=Candidatus Zymogenus saltonus TaxID=2844893 RepID=A0A9D8PNJ1_9DELT|nr:methylated-DNA--[protein]-cysteine S-methyltransferase [Candidatus Zymogenus saltonus]
MKEIKNVGIFSTTFGWMGVVSSDAGILFSMLPRVERGDVEKGLKSYLGTNGIKAGEDASCGEIEDAMKRFFEGEAVDLTRFPLDFSGISPFFVSVYGVVKGIDRGRVMSYNDVAKAAGSPGGARGVGSAMARNRFAPFVPCHRVVGKNGDLVGFGGGNGIEMKERMLFIEGIESRSGSKFRVPREFFASR